jgi:predicted DNA-binding transcriptional regulator YafY
MESDDAEAGRNSSLQRTARLLDDLIRGNEHDRNTAAALLGLAPAAADRQLKAVSTVTGVEVGRKTNRRVYRFEPAALMKPPSQATVIATCFGSSLWRLFDGTAYEQGMRQALEFVVSKSRQRANFENIDRKFVFVPRGGEVSLPDDVGLFDDVIEAVLKHRWLALRYQHFEGEVRRVRVQPLSIAVYEHQLYLLGRPEGTQDIVPFRFSRIESAHAEGGSFAYPSRAEYDPEQVFVHSFGIFVSHEYPLADLKVRLDPRWKNYVRAHRWHRSQRVTEQGKHLLLEMQLRICPEVEAWLLGLGDEAEVLEPEWLRAKMAKRIEKMARRYRGKR